MSKEQTRGQSLGVKPSTIDRYTQTRIDGIRERLLEIAYAWNEVDNRVCLEADDVVSALDALVECVKESVDLLRKPREEG